jgi:hypothetical protein
MSVATVRRPRKGDRLFVLATGEQVEVVRRAGHTVHVHHWDGINEDFQESQLGLTAAADDVADVPVVDDVSTLADLMSRAGASDEDRPAWLAERAQGVTATEVRDAQIGGAPKRDEIADRKRHQRELISAGKIDEAAQVGAVQDNKWMAWGRKREPVIADWVRTRYGIAWEHRVFHHTDDSRLLASPDGIGLVDGRLVLAEIKTAGVRKMPGTKAFEHAGYALQMQWQMFVTGAQRCLYVLEEHDGDWQDRGGQFEEPEPISFGGDVDPEAVWVDRDEHVIAELKKTALAVLDLVEHPPVDPTPFVEPLSDFFLLKDQFESAKASFERAQDTVRALLPAGGSVQVPGLARVTVSLPRPGERFSARDFEKVHPDLYREFLRPTKPGKPRLTVTAEEVAS